MIALCLEISNLLGRGTEFVISTSYEFNPVTKYIRDISRGKTKNPIPLPQKWGLIKSPNHSTSWLPDRVKGYGLKDNRLKGEKLYSGLLWRDCTKFWDGKSRGFLENFKRVLWNSDEESIYSLGQMPTHSRMNLFGYRSLPRIGDEKSPFNLWWPFKKNAEQGASRFSLTITPRLLPWKKKLPFSIFMVKSNRVSAVPLEDLTKGMPGLFPDF